MISGDFLITVLVLLQEYGILFLLIILKVDAGIINMPANLEKSIIEVGGITSYTFI